MRQSRQPRVNVVLCRQISRKLSHSRIEKLSTPEGGGAEAAGEESSVGCLIVVQQVETTPHVPAFFFFFHVLVLFWQRCTDCHKFDLPKIFPMVKNSILRAVYAKFYFDMLLLICFF